MKILVDENIPFANETFGQHGELIRYAGRDLQPENLIGVDVLITRSITKVNAELLVQHSPGFVGTCTIGIDHLDVPFLESSNIGWAYAPGCNAQSVVDYVVSVIAALGSDELPKSVGIVGCGNVGGLLRQRMLLMGLEIHAYDPFLSAEQIPELCSLEQVVQSDMVCLHTPYTETGAFPTRSMIGKEHLNLLPKNALLISAGRGGVIKEDELLNFMGERSDIRVALDVWASEPCINEHLLERVAIATPHIAGYALEGKLRGTTQIYKAFCKHFSFETCTLPELPGANLPEVGETCSETVLAAYNPQLDMHRMRNSYALANRESREKGSWFDELRRSYPERREMAGFRLNTESLNRDQIVELERRGF